MSHESRDKDTGEGSERLQGLSAAQEVMPHARKLGDDLQALSAAPAPASPEEDGEDDELLSSGRSFRDYLYGTASCVVSMVVHVGLLVALAVLSAALPEVREVQTIVSTPFEECAAEDPVEFELQEQIEVVTEQTAAVFSTAVPIGVPGGVGGTVGLPSLDQKVVREAATATSTINIESPTIGLPVASKLIQAVPDGEFKGDSCAIVDDYQQALDRMTQEIMWMLDKGHVLTVWLFDQSESMKDDQKEIRDRVDMVYTQLGISGRTKGDALTTSVASFGGEYLRHTRRPVSDRAEIRTAIDAVPTDPSGKELMCTAVGRAIAEHREYTRKGGRQMALILVTDESGDQENNERLLEAAIAEAKSANCRIYVLGREAVFGYPFAHIRWVHPQTKRVHWLRIDRGPETGFVEQLQTNGFHRRHDAFSSGYGPYEQTRMAWETGGIFFMLPSVEVDLVQGEKRRYALDIMRPFRPDLRPRPLVLADRDKYPLRTLIWKVITDLNPYHPQTGRIVEVRVEFSPEPNNFVRQVRQEQQKALLLIRYLGEAQKALEQGKKLRAQEADPRWQANYDLIYAQVIAYQARLYEYGAGLEAFLRNPKTAPPTKAPDLVLDTWDIRTISQTLTKESQPYIDRAKELFTEVSELHSGTPWDARAKEELSRGFGIDLVPDYEPPLPNISNLMQPPKL